MKPARKHNCQNFIYWIYWIRILLLIVTTSHAATIYIDAANQGAKDGSKDKPFNTIQEGIGVAQSGDTVRVAPGTYKGEVRFKDGITLQGSGTDVTKITIVAADDCLYYHDHYHYQ